MGLLQPGNVLILTGPDPDWSLILPDVGFLQSRGILPEWMRPDCTFCKLWDALRNR